MIITGYNPDIEDLELSYLSSSVSASAGSAVLVVKNNDRFAVNDRIMVGQQAREKTEVTTVTSVSVGTGVTTNGLNFPHSADDPVYKLRFDTVKFYRSTTGSSGAYSLVSSQPLDVDNANGTTVYDDTTGLATYYYKVSYYNSITTVESSLSDPVLGSGYTRNSVGFMIDEILRDVGDLDAQYVSRTEVISWFNAVNDDLLTRSKRPFRFLHTRTALSRTANATTLSFPTDMWKFDRMDYVYTDTAGNISTYPVRAKRLADFRYNYGDSSGGTANDELQFISLDDAVDAFRLWPRSLTTSPNVFYVYYYKLPNTLDSEGDVFETDTPAVYKLYALHRFYLKKSAADPIQLNFANTWAQKYESEVAKLKRGENKDAGTPGGFRYDPQTYKGNRRF